MSGVGIPLPPKIVSAVRTNQLKLTKFGFTFWTLNRHWLVFGQYLLQTDMLMDPLNYRTG